MTGVLLLPVVLLAEWVLGYPRWLLNRIGHPVMWMGALIAALDRGWNHGSPRRQRVMGCAMLAVLTGLSAACGWLIQSVLALSLWLWPLMVLVASAGLAQRSLAQHVEAVAAPLLAGDLDAARTAAGMIVGRDVAGLDETGIATAAIESLAESFGDGIVTPACWLALAGLPGLAAAKAINTADSMVGHKDAHYRYFGWASARADDVINWAPARLSGALIALAAGRGWRVMRRDARLHASPNAGWPEAAMAGALGRQLGGAVSYDGEIAHRAALGEGPRPEAKDLLRALAIWRRACALLWALAAALAGAFLWLR
ncbi:MAG: adenosylcobinamide-phosphate synthase CbiB [Erythrobacter sp.]